MRVTRNAGEGNIRKPTPVYAIRNITENSRSLTHRAGLGTASVLNFRRHLFIGAANLRAWAASILAKTSSMIRVAKPAAIAGVIRREPWITEKIVEHRIERDDVRMVGHLFAVAIREARKATHVHAHRLVVDFHIGCADMFRVRAALDFDFLNASAFGGAITAQKRRRSAITLHKLGIVHIAAESALYSLEVGVMPVCSKLNPIA